MVGRISGTRLRALLGQERSEQPTYLWVADGVRAAVADGRVLPGMRLPSERELAPALGVSRTTVTRAYGVLVERGYARAEHGSGTRVTLPGGAAAGGGEPLADEPIDPDTANFMQAAPPATPGLQAAFERALEQLPRYTAGRGYFPYGIPPLREAIAQRYRDRGVATTADQIVVTTGATAAASLALTSLTPRGVRVSLDSPGYPNTVAAVRAIGRRPVAVPAAGGEFDAEEFEQISKQAPACLTVVDFKNPTGLLLDDADRDRLAHIWRSQSTLAVVDETLCETWLEKRPDVLPMAAHHDAVITVGSASKTHWGGLRLGWVRAPRQHVRPLAVARRTTDLGSSVLDQLALAEMLTEQPGLHSDTRAALIESRDLLMDFGQQRGWQAQRPSGGLSIWWRLPTPRSRQLVAAAAREGVGLLSGAAFAASGNGLDGFMRTPFALRPHEIRELLPALDCAVQTCGLSGSR
ncbi:PLP-dependent aminotransferase family protein [Yimella sp. cx-51]|uniref:aminotransferase-like domain-containing protein n=1 Tax=Yimella sp. cx-51 TaxID=2770551 RepID=UPI00165EA54B|nr:PLP-dependent aminotransferase family protein [Yimella sp. cx-51]MBC9957673.1 PLP-dependent aminotransferase family protein [Yimella sp. cx-51]QTH36971.1 PLP-dependent aminotransferase family protein [Yimella sp. cx-51]